MDRLIWALAWAQISWIRDKDILSINGLTWKRLEMDGGEKIWLECQCDQDGESQYMQGNGGE